MQSEGKKATQEGWVPDRGLREGCPSSPILFNIFHQAVMRQARIERQLCAQESGKKVGVSVMWVPGSSLPGKRLWEKSNSEAIEVVVDLSLFADDTTVVGDKEELEDGVAATKRVMSRFEERNNDDKEEELPFEREGSSGIRMIGCWLGWNEDLKQRLARAGSAWAKLRGRLKGSKMLKKVQARVVEACVESCLFFDCQVRVWY